MKQMKQWLMMAAAVVALCGSMTGCKADAGKPVNGTMDNPVEMGNAPEAVYNVMKKITRTDERLETLMEDKASGVAVYSLMRCDDETSSEGYGILVAKGDVVTAFPKIRHGNMPRARYDAQTDDLWLACGEVEGTGVLAEALYCLHFDDKGHAEVTDVINPYLVQQAACKMLTYKVDGQEITFYSEGKQLAQVTNHITDMGEIMDDAIYIGEQITYSIDTPMTVHITPGLNFVTGKVLLYDDMPTFNASWDVLAGGQMMRLYNIKLDAEP